MPYVDRGPMTIEDLEGRNFATVPEVAAILECDPRTVRTACSLNEIPHTMVGTHFRIPVSWLRQQVEGAVPVAS